MPSLDGFSICKTCKQSMPLSYFDDEGGDVCRMCAPMRSMSKKEVVAGEATNIREKATKLAAKQVMANLTRDSIDVPHTSELAAAMIKRFHGLDGFADAYFEVVSRIISEDPGSRLALKAMENMSKLIKESTIMRDTAPDVKSVSDEELEIELRRIIEKGVIDGRIDLPSMNPQRPSLEDRKED